MSRCLTAAACALVASAVAAASDPVWVKVAAAGSTAEAKTAADFVCAGTNDQETIQKAIELCAKDGRNLYLYNGLYMIDAFREWGDGGPMAGVRIPNMRRHFVVQGQGFFQAGRDASPSNGVVWYARSSIWATAGTGIPSVLRGEWTKNGIGSMWGAGLRLENLSIFICDAQHPARCVDLRCNDGVEVRNMRLRGMGDRCVRGDAWPYTKFGPLPMPHPDSIGLTMTGGSNIPVARYDNIHASGFGQAFQAGGEHVICSSCLASFNLYGWTFGNYEFGTPRGAGDNHPIVLINCGDEQNVHMPLFTKCGDDGGRIHGMQSVTMVGMNFERVPGYTIGGKVGDSMRETRPGTWRGHIEYTMQPAWHATNGVHQALWEEDGSGSGFETRNLAHKRIGTSAERRSYYPQLGQQYFDTDLGKLLICTEPAKRKWVDAMGVPAEREVPPERMREIYETVKTPHKVGMVLAPEEDEMLDNPMVFRHGGSWYMMFIRFDGKGYETHLAKSDDLVSWQRLGCIFRRGEKGAWDSAQADGWPALVDTRWDGPNTLNTFQGKYWMMYLGGAKAGYETDPLSTGVAWTDDPSAVREWTRYAKNPVMSPSDPDARDFEKKTIYKHFTVEDPSRSCGGRFVNFYNAKPGGVWRETIGMAVSDDMLHWRRVGGGPVVENGDVSRAGISGDPMIRRIGDLWVMFYFGHQWKPGVNGAFDTFACSYDLKSWTKWDGEPLVKPSEPYDAKHAHKPWVLKHDGVVYHFYCAVGDKGRGIALATSEHKQEATGKTEDWALRIAGRSMWFSTAESSPGKMLVLYSSPWEADVSRDESGKVTLTYSYSHPDHPDWAWTSKLSFVPTDSDEMECEFFETRANRPGGDIHAKGVAKRIPPLPPAPNLGKLTFSEPIDLLADGLDGWETIGDRTNLWTFKDGVLENGGRGGANIRTKRGDFTDFRLSYDVRADKGCNSGVYLRGIYEIQTIDSYGKKPDSHNMGAVYGRVTPSITADRPAGEWQHVDVTLCDRHATVVLNGVKIIDNAPLRGNTGGALSPDQFAPGPIMIQGSHNGGAYRNMVLTPIVPAEAAREGVLARRSGWLAKAEAAKPRIFRRDVSPVGLVRTVADASAFQGWRMEAADSLDDMLGKPLADGDSFVIDFGEHLVGTVEFNLVDLRCVDAPIRLGFTFAEVPLELVEDSDVTMGKGWKRLSRAWIQKDTMTIDAVPSANRLSRRYSFRYVKVEVLGCSGGSCRFGGIRAVAETSADESALKPWTAPSPAAAKIESVARRTLRDCMQTVFEDGPKRDRRLWLGDLRLEAIANYATYRNFGIVKRSLYLLAGLSDDDGYVRSDAYERPAPRMGGCKMLDYTALYAATVLDYLEASGDRETAKDLWPLCVRQLHLLLLFVGEDGVFRDEGNGPWRCFIDHCRELNRQTAGQGGIAFGFRATLRLAKKLGKERDVAFLEEVIRRMERGANEKLWDESRGLYVCEKDAQASVHGQAWLVLGGIAQGERAKRCMQNAMEDKSAIRPVSPYAHHYLVEALHGAGLHREADEHMNAYWGRMVELGADTFWEVFVPEDHRSSPYGTPLLNSYCHAWSCTPVCFLRNERHIKEQIAKPTFLSHAKYAKSAK